LPIISFCNKARASVMNEEPTPANQPRLLVVPGLHDSPSGHWQSWLQDQFPTALRVVQRDWATADIERWAGRIASTLDRAGAGPRVAVAHSFGALAVARHLALVPQTPLAAVLFVAPADPDRFGIGELLPQQALRLPATLLLSSNDPWLGLAAGQRWAQRWGSPCVNLGPAGHINVQSGFRTLPYARHWVLAQTQRLARQAAEPALVP
jgi:predicted alpha/beta hydrolase family esterase